MIDNINKLAEQDPALLRLLQDGAKDAVGSGLFKTVFVTSDGAAPTQLMGDVPFDAERSAISRGEFFRIGDMTKEESFAYLEKRGVYKSEVENSEDKRERLIRIRTRNSFSLRNVMI